MLDNGVLPLNLLTCCLFTEYFVCTPSGIVENIAVHDTHIINASASAAASPLVHREHCGDHKQGLRLLALPAKWLNYIQFIQVMHFFQFCGDFYSRAEQDDIQLKYKVHLS